MGLLNKPIILLINLYSLIVSPFLGSNCRFYPSCSQYAKISFSRYGLWRASKLTVLRLLRCHPWHAGGVDEVPGCNNKLD
ncbi:MAG: membrane protein insertion efficiency factor YidD [Legionellales bacterium]|nr:MAG: membrane protein insertion efficiency factor YidD [Legionellales bacterium]